MRDRVRVLHVDDDPGFADLTATYLERADERFEVFTATGAEAGLERLADREIHCVVSDYEMPGTDGLEFLGAVRDRFPDLPFLLFTGKGSEEIASEAISAGVTDYLQKGTGGDQYDLLANRVANAVDRYDTERERRRWKEAVETATQGVAIVDPDGRFWQTNDAYADIYGTSPDELAGTPPRKLYPADEQTRLETEIMPGLDRAGHWEGEVVGRRVDGTSFDQRLAMSTLPDGGHVCVIEDITERKERERELQRQNERMADLIEKHEAAETRYQSLFENNPIVIWEEDLSAVKERLDTLATEVEDLESHLADRETLLELVDAIEIVDVNQYAVEHYAADSKSHLVANLEEISTERSLEAFRQEFLALARDETELTLETQAWTFDGDLKDEYLHIFTPDSYADDYSVVYATAMDITERKERERELGRKNDLFRKAQAIADVGAWEYDIRADDLRWTDQVYEIHGLPADREVTPEEGIEFYHPEDRETIREALARAVEDGEPFDLELRLVTADGETRWVRTMGDPQTEDDEVVRVRGTFQDVTARREREREADLLREMVESLGVGVAIYDTDGQFDYVNPAYAEILGTDVATLQGLAVWDVNPAIDHDDFVSYWSSFADGETRVHETTHRFDGREVPVQTVTTQQTIHGETYHFGTVQDITDRKRQERELQRQNERLAEFASIVSHDLRNPLEVARGHVDLLRDERDSDRLDAVTRAHERMATLIEDILALAREGRAVDDPSAVDIGAVVEDCRATVETEGATLVVETDRTVLADRSRLQQLFENLFRNSVEHGGTDVTITVGDCEDGFYVEDDGRGIPPDRREDIFERGYSTAEDGTGFGMAIIREIADAHDWSVRATKGESGGARFEISGVDGPT
jgi:PAS domain S-box-containing protein